MKVVAPKVLAFLAVTAAATLLPRSGVAGVILGSSFGEDTNGGSPALLHPNADAAKTGFFSAFNVTAVQDFEALAGYSSPTVGGGTIDVVNQLAGGRFPIGGSYYLRFSTGAATDSFTMSNSPGAYGFGFYGIDIGDFGENLSLRLNFSDTTSELVTVPHLASSFDADGSVFYFGVRADTPITTVEFINKGGNGNAILAFDDVAGAFEPVPEPATLTLLGVGLMGLGLGTRKKA